jgi:oxalate decarboxylase/phosphoglucose isomerase-like protein (cupin superfamily)
MLVNVLLALVASASALALPLNDNTLAKRDATTDTIAALKAANSAVERSLILAKGGNASFGFDFGNPPTTSAVIKSPGGKLTIADGATFPALTGVNAALAIVNVDPCAVILPHTHPRSEEFALVVEGQLKSQFITETGSIVVTNTLKTWQSILYPQGSIHYEYNAECKPATFVAAFNDNDPGTSFIVPNFFSFDDQVVIASVGGETVVSGADLASIRHAIPQGLAAGVEQCLKKCNIKPFAKRSIAEVLAR